MVIREDITQESNFRATNHFQVWLQENKLVGICGIDTRHITHILRENGSINAAIVHKKNGMFGLKNIFKKRSQWGGIAGCDLTEQVTRKKNVHWNQATWMKMKGYVENKKKRYL